MNIFCPQSIAARVELERLADVRKVIIAPSNSIPIIGISQDGLLGSYNMTHDNQYIDWRSAMNIIGNTSYIPEKFIKSGKISGKNLYSYIIPNGINVRSDKFTVKRGEILNGRLTKKWLGSGQRNNLIQLILDEYSYEETSDFINRTQKITNHFNMHRGFSVGYGDLVVPDKVKQDVEKFIATKELKIEHLITDVENNPELMDKDLVELKIYSELNSIREDTSKIVLKSISPSNNFKIMIDSGSKGKDINLGQIAACAGMQSFKNFLIEKKYNRRTSPYYFKDDDRAESRGFTKYPYTDGMPFAQFIYQCLTGREGLVNQKGTTADTGYAQRRIIKFMEDVKVNADGTVRKYDGVVCQFVYGDSGASTTKQSPYTISTIEMSNMDINSVYLFNKEELDKYREYSEKDNRMHVDEIVKLRDIIRRAVTTARNEYITLKKEFMIPVNLKRILDNNIDYDAKGTSDLTPDYVIDKIQELMSNRRSMLLCMSSKESINNNYVKNIDEQLSKIVFKAAIFEALSPKRCIMEYKLKKNKFDEIIDKISTSYNDNIVEANDMVGVVCGQSMGEPLSQMALRAFHSAGVGEVVTTTSGLPRVKEILGGSKNIRTPQVTIYLNREYQNNKDYVQKLASNIKYTTLGEVVEHFDCYFENDGKGTLAKNDGIRNNFYVSKNESVGNEHNPFVLRIAVDREKMIEKEVSVLEIISKFGSWWEQRLSSSSSISRDVERTLRKIPSIDIQSTSDNDPNPVIHIRFSTRDIEGDKKKRDPFNLETIDDFTNLVENFKLKGVDGITGIASTTEKRLIQFLDDGSMELTKQFIINTEGSTIEDLRYVRNIDFNRTISNDIMDVYEKYGIEVARTLIIKELDAAYSSAGHTVNYQHFCLLVDMMTFYGEIISVDRNGFDKISPPPLSAASFEKTPEHLVAAAIFGRDDNMKGVSAQIMAGNLITGGTGGVDTMVDLESIIHSEHTEYNRKENAPKIHTNQIIEDIAGRDDDDEGEEEDVFIPI